MADSPIIEVAVNDEEFTRFLEKFEGYKKDAANPSNPFASAAASLHEAGNAVGALSEEFGALAKSASSSSMNGNSSFIARWAKGSHDASKDWANTSRSIDKSRKDLISFNRTWSTIKSVGKDIGIVGGTLAAGFVTAVRAADNLARKNLESKSLGIPIGRADAFEANYGPLGLDRGTITQFADAQQDTRQWLPMIAARVPGDDIEHASPDELAIESFKAMSTMYGQWQRTGINAAQMAEVFGYTKFFSPSQLRAGAAWGEQKLDSTHDKFETDATRMGVDAATGDNATQFKQQWQADLTTLSNAFDTQIGNSTTQLGHFTTAVTDAALNLINWLGPKGAKLADQSATVIDDLSKPPMAAPVDGQYDHSLEGGLRKFGDGVRSLFPGIPDTTTGTIAPSSVQLKIDPTVDPATLNAYRNLSGLAEQKYHLPAGLQSLQMSEESRFRRDALNKDSGASGLMQFTPDTARAMGINPYDPAQAIDAGGKLLRNLIDQNGGSLAKGLAAYGGDTHITADSKHYKSWLLGAKQETLNYLRPFADAGYAMGLSVDELAFLRAHSQEFNKAKNDANLRVSADAALGPGESVVDATNSKQESTSLKKRIEDAVRTKRMAMEETADNFLRILHEGGGAQFSNNNNLGRSKTAEHQGNRSPVLIDVKVSTPAGSSTSVALNGVPK